MKKAIIYMEVACGCRGGVINRDYHNNKSVKWLKNAVSDWRWTKEYGNTCPDCLAKMKGGFYGTIRNY